MSLQQPKSMYSACCTLQEVEKIKYHGIVHTTDGRRNKEVDTRIRKANALLPDHYISVLKKQVLRCFQTLQKHHFFVGFSSDPHPKYKCKKWYFCEESAVKHSLTKYAVLNFVKP